MSASTPVGFLYTPQQLAGSVRYGSGVLLGNWREDDALDEMRVMDHTAAKESGSLTLLKKQQKIAPQKAPMALTAAPSDGIMKIGDVVTLQSQFNGSTLAVSLGQQLRTGDTVNPDPIYTVVGAADPSPCARNAIKIVSYDGSGGASSPLLYGQKVCLEFSSALGCRGYLSSVRGFQQQLSTLVINKQECFMKAIAEEAPPYDCAWMLLPQNVDQRIVAQGSPVLAGAPFVLVHCFTNQRLASVNVGIPTDFGSELGVCVHTFTEATKVNKLMRETTGKPSHNLISRTETDENLWCAFYA